jgi:alpha-1,2-mannosyltransferase
MQTAYAAAPQSIRSRENRVALTVFLILLTIVFTVKHSDAESPTYRWDFQQFYIVAQMIRHGAASKLYDFSSQAAFQTSYIDRTRSTDTPDLPFLYPAATALLFLPLAWLPLTVAYAAWTACNLLLLLASLRLLQRHLPMGGGDRPLFFALLFAPVYVCILNGQLSILVLFLYTLAFVLMRQGRLFLAGCAIGLAAVKFQLILGFVAVLVLRRCWKSVAGASATILAVAAVSAMVGGWRQVIAYPVLLRNVANHPHVAYTSTMVNLRGLLRLTTGHEPLAWIAAALSALLIVIAAQAWRDVETGFSVALIASVFSSYHAYFSELTLLLIPFAVFVARAPWNRWSISLTAFALVASYCLTFPNLYGIAGVLCYMLILIGLYRSRVKRPSAAIRLTAPA